MVTAPRLSKPSPIGGADTTKEILSDIAPPQNSLSGRRGGDRDAAEEDVEDETGRAVAWARQTPEPDAGELEAYVYRQPVVLEPGAAVVRPPADGPTFRVMDAIHDALAMSLETDPDVFLA